MRKNRKTKTTSSEYLHIYFSKTSGNSASPPEGEGASAERAQLATAEGCRDVRTPANGRRHGAGGVCRLRTTGTLSTARAS